MNLPTVEQIFGRMIDPTLVYTKQAHERIQEFNRLKRARYLLDAIFLTNELLSDGSDVEILSLASTIINRFKSLGVFNVPGKKSVLNIKAYESVF